MGEAAFDMSEVKWRYGRNMNAVLWHMMLRGRHPLNAQRQAWLDALVKDGFVSMPLTDLLAFPNNYAKLEAWAEQVVQLDPLEGSGASHLNAEMSQQKRYLRSYFDNGALFTPQHVALATALDRNVITIVNAYFGMMTKLLSISLWRNLVNNNPPERSQKWHRDREDKMIIKLFVYLSDVKQSNGALGYIPGSHARGNRVVPVATHQEAGHGNFRANDEDMAVVVPENEWAFLEGAKGTAVLVDTTGYHKGGHCLSHERLVYVAEFTTKQAALPRNYVLSDNRLKTLGIHPWGRYALR